MSGDPHLDDGRDMDGSGDEPMFALLELTLGPRPRRGTSSALRGTKIGNVTFQGWQIDPVETDPVRYPEAQSYLVQVNYDVAFEPTARPAAWLDVGLTFRTDGDDGDVTVVDIMPRHVDEVTGHATYAVTESLDFAPVDVGRPAGASSALADLPACRPIVDGFGAASATAWWQHRAPVDGRFPTGSHRAWITLLVPSACRLVFVRAHADFDCPGATRSGLLVARQAHDDEVAVDLPVTDVLRLQGRRRSGGVAGDAAGATTLGVSAAGIRTRLGFTVDIEGFSGRDGPQKDDLQRRLDELVRSAVAATGIAFEDAMTQPAGDLLNVFLPDIDQTVALPTFLRAMRDGLRRDNDLFRDRMRLRLAVDIGTVGPSRLGYSGDAIISVYRLAHARAVRQWLVDHPAADLAVIVSDRVYSDFIAPRYPGLDPQDFRRANVQQKGFRARAWLWDVGTPSQASARPTICR